MKQGLLVATIIAISLAREPSATSGEIAEKAIDVTLALCRQLEVDPNDGVRFTYVRQ